MYTLPIDVSKLDDLDYLKTLKLHKYVQDNRVLLKYQREELEEHENNTIGKFRSVIFSDHKLVCYSPPKSTLLSFEDSVVEEFIDGTMINVFYDKEWVISTKSVLNADTRFYQHNPTFKDLFQETCIYCKLSLDQLNPNKCYSFVMQHPSNRIVSPVSIPALYLVEMYSIDGLSVQRVFSKEELSNTSVQYPKTFSFISREEMSVSQPFAIKGYMLKEKNGINREKYINPAYTKVQEIRGNEHHLTFTYLHHKKNKTQKEWLMYYPEYRNLCNTYKERFNEYLNQLYQHYVDCFIHKKKNLKEYDNRYKFHMYTLQGIYLNKLRPQRMTKYLVYDYLIQLEPKHLHSILSDIVE